MQACFSCGICACKGQWNSLLWGGPRYASPCAIADSLTRLVKGNVPEPLTSCLHYLLMLLLVVPLDARFREFSPRQFRRHFFVPRRNQHVRPIVTGSILLGALTVTIIRDVIKTDFPFMQHLASVTFSTRFIGLVSFLNRVYIYESHQNLRE